MKSNEERKLLEIARLLNEHQGEKGMSAFISKALKVSGRDLGKAKRMMNDGLIFFDDKGEPRLIVPADKFEYFLLGKVVSRWAEKRGISPQEITDALINEFFTEISEFLELELRKRGRPKGSSIKPQLSILSALMDGPKSFQGIVDATGLHRNTVANNLKILASMEMLAKSKIHGKPIYQIDPIRPLFFFRLLALKGNIKAKKAMRMAQKEMKPVQQRLRLMVKFLRKIVELLINQPELISRDFDDILYFAAEGYSIEREKYSIKHEKTYLPSHPQRQVLKIKDACSSLGDTNRIMQGFLKTFLKSIMETEDVKNLILSGRARNLKIFE